MEMVWSPMERADLTLRRLRYKRLSTTVRWTWLLFQWILDAHCLSQSLRDSRITGCTWDHFQDSTLGDIPLCLRCWRWLDLVIWDLRQFILLRMCMICAMCISRVWLRTLLLRNWLSMKVSRYTDISSLSHWQMWIHTEISVIERICQLVISL